jgi:hypothetical protein
MNAISSVSMRAIPIPRPTFILLCPSLCFAPSLWARRSALRLMPRSERRVS